MSVDLDAWMAAWRGPLTGWFTRRGAALVDADERVAEVFARAWLHRERFRGDAADDGAASAWLLGIARNVEREARRRRAPRSLEGVAHPEAPPSDEEAQARDETRRVRAAIQRLPPQERALVVAFYFDGTSAARVAHLLGLTERAVEGRLRRARERLRAWLSASAASGLADSLTP